MIRRRLAVVAAALVMATAASARAAEPVPAALQPAGYMTAFSAKAKGVQIYVSTLDGDTLKWVLEAPLARLTARRGKLVIHHYAGPSWEAEDGSKLVRDKGEQVVSTPAPDAEADIPWLLVKVTADPTGGALAKVGYIQRIATKGGLAPATSPVRADTKVGVPYSATYVFLVKAE
jgi:hypothetical protein